MNHIRALVNHKASAPVRPAVYARELIVHPAAWMTTTLAVGVAITQLGVVAVGAVFVCVVLAIAGFARWPRMQRVLDARRTAEQSREHRCMRETRVQEANVSINELRELATVVANIERVSPEDVARFELDALLDRYAELAIAHARCEEGLRTVDRAVVARSLEVMPPETSPRRAVLERQLACWTGQYEQAKRYREEMLAITELLTLIAARVRSPATEMDMGEVERRLAQLDDEDAARRELED